MGRILYSSSGTLGARGIT